MTAARSEIVAVPTAVGRVEVYTERIPGLPVMIFVERFEDGPEPTDIVDLTTAEARRLHAELGELLDGLPGAGARVCGRSHR